MTRKQKTALLLAVLFAAALAGVYLAASPTLEQKRLDSSQAALLRHIETGGGVVKLPKQAGKPLPDYDEPEDVDVFPLTSQIAAPEEPAPEQETAPEEITGIGILTIDRIGARLPVSAGVTQEQLKVSEGWVTQTAPIGMEGNAVIAGHRSYTYGRHFNRLGDLQANDEIRYTTAGGEEMTFVVSEILTVEPGDPATFAAPPEGVAQLTLYTCTPTRTATHRLLVRAVRVD